LDPGIILKQLCFIQLGRPTFVRKGTDYFGVKIPLTNVIVHIFASALMKEEFQ